MNQPIRAMALILATLASLPVSAQTLRIGMKAAVDGSDPHQSYSPNRNVQMQNEFAALRSLKGTANNNLAGATYAQSLSTEMEAVASKYKALNDVDQERLKVLRADLATARQALGK